MNPYQANLHPQTPVTPRQAAALILLRNPAEPQVFWVKRARTLAFMGGFHAFPGGQLDANDAATPIANVPASPACVDEHAAAMRVCAVREAFEETGVLLAHGAQRLSAAERAALREEFNQGQLSFQDLLAREGLTLDAALLREAPSWTTPAASPRRYYTRFYTAWLPAEQDTEVIPGELEAGEWLAPQEALCRWTDGDCMIVTPILAALQALTCGAHDFTDRLHALTQATRDLWEQRVEMRRGFYVTPLRTPTIPPATHTNAYFIGDEEMILVDPGSPYADEQARLDNIIIAFLNEGRRLRELVITHLHPDHIGGVMHVAHKFNVPVAAHRLTAEAIRDEVRVDRLIEDDDLLVLRNTRDAHEWRLRALWTPGHARGHLSFYEERTGTLVTGDCVVGFGTVVIAPPEGELTAYLASLERYLTLPRLTALLPGHGPIIADARGKITEYIAHRHTREQQILTALHDGARTIPALVQTIYTEVAPALHPLAELSVRAHLDKLRAEARVQEDAGAFALV